MAGLVGAAIVLLAVTRAAQPPPSRSATAEPVEALLARHQFGMAQRLLLFQRRAECAEAARQLELVYHVAIAPNSDVMEAFAAAEAALALDRLLGSPLAAELVERRAAVAGEAARAYRARGLDTWARRANQFAR